MTLESVSPKFKVGIDRNQCINCGRCVENCFHGVYRRESDKFLIESRKCTACLRCVIVCPKSAITINAKSKFRNWILSIKNWILSKLKRWKKIPSNRQRRK